MYYRNTAYTSHWSGEQYSLYPCNIIINVFTVYGYYSHSRYIEVFRSSHAEVRPVKSTSRPTPYSRPGGRGGFAGYGGYGSKYGSGYERGYNRGRGRGPPQGHFHPPYDTYGGTCTVNVLYILPHSLVVRRVCPLCISTRSEPARNNKVR